MKLTPSIAQQLRDAPVGPDGYVEYLMDVLEGAVELDDADAVFSEAFSFFERNDAADLGSPGPLVHFLERFYPAHDLQTGMIALSGLSQQCLTAVGACNKSEYLA